MMYGLKTYVLTKRQEVQLKMLRLLFEMTRIRNEHIRGRALIAGSQFAGHAKGGSDRV